MPQQTCTTPHGRLERKVDIRQMRMYTHVALGVRQSGPAFAIAWERSEALARQAGRTFRIHVAEAQERLSKESRVEIPRIEVFPVDQEVL